MIDFTFFLTLHRSICTFLLYKMILQDVRRFIDAGKNKNYVTNSLMQALHHYNQLNLAESISAYLALKNCNLILSLMHS